MNFEKRSKYSMVYQVAGDLRDNQVKVRSIITTYLNVCREELFDGHIVRFLGFFTLVPNEMKDEFISTTAMHCKMTAERLNLPYHTVRGVIRKYSDSCKTDLKEGRPVEFRRLAKLVPSKEDGKITNVFGTISVTIGSELGTRSSGVTSARLHVCKILKRQLQQSDSLEVS